MPVDPDCDTGDCGEDEPPDPGEECVPPDCVSRSCRILDSTSRYGERIGPSVAINGYIIHRTHPQIDSAAVWDDEQANSTFYYSDAVLNPNYVNCATSWPTEPKYTYTGTGNAGGFGTTGYTVAGIYGAFVLGGYNTIWVDLYSGSYAPGVIQPPDVPVVIIQLRIAYKDGGCVLQSRSFPFADTYAVDLNEIPSYVNGYVTYPLTEQELTDGQDATYPWTDDAIPMPVNGVMTIGLDSGWFGNGTSGLTVFLDCGNCGPEPMSGEQTYTVTLNAGKPSWAPSSFTAYPNKNTTISASFGRTHMIYAPNGGWNGPPWPIQRKFVYTTTATVGEASLSFAPGGNSSIPCGPIVYMGPVLSEATCKVEATMSYDNGVPAPQYDYVNTETPCATIFSPAASAMFVADYLKSNRNSADSVTYTGMWVMEREGTGQTSVVGDYPCVSASQVLSYRTGTITITRNACVGPETADVSVSINGGAIDGISVNGNGGQCYASPPGITISGGGGSGATAYADVANGHVTSITITNQGSNYSSDPAVSPFTVNGLTLTSSPVLKPSPCMPEECLGSFSTWLAKPVEDKLNGKITVEWFLINDCPGTCVSEPDKSIEVTKPTFFDFPCKCPENASE